MTYIVGHILVSKVKARTGQELGLGKVEGIRAHKTKSSVAKDQEKTRRAAKESAAQSG